MNAPLRTQSRVVVILGASSKAIIDVTPRAAEALGFKGGEAKVKLEIQK